MKHIPMHKIRDRVDTGFEIHHTTAEKLREDGDKLGIHRDDHYIFFLIEEGAASVKVEFAEMTLSSRSGYYMLPGQVPPRLKATDGTGWFLAVDAALIANEFRDIFE